jgi:DNA topoisomerase VI subunit B
MMPDATMLPARLRIWVGVEVKSRVSDGNPDDYERGLYQVVKYKAVLEAQARIDYPDNPPEVHVLLALENELPADRRELAAALRVRYLERVFRHGPQATVVGAEVHAPA